MKLVSAKEATIGNNFSEIRIWIKHFHSWKCIWKCHLRNGFHFPGGDELNAWKVACSWSNACRCCSNYIFILDYLASMDWAKTTARRDEKHLSFFLFGVPYTKSLTLHRVAGKPSCIFNTSVNMDMLSLNQIQFRSNLLPYWGNRKYVNAEYKMQKQPCIFCSDICKTKYSIE